jgi:predicted nucleotide-binding protein
MRAALTLPFRAVHVIPNLLDMAHVPVEIIDLRKSKTNDLPQAIEIANACQEEFFFISAAPNFSHELKLNVSSEVYSVRFFDAIDDARVRLKGYHPFLFVFIDAPLRNDRMSNLFSDRRAARGLAIVTTADLVGVILKSDQMTAYFLFQLARLSLGLVVDSLKSHKERRGCIFDMRINKRDIVSCMESGALCDACKEFLLQNGRTLSPSQLTSIECILDETSRSMKPQIAKEMAKQRIFVGSSTEGLKVARAIQAELQHEFFVEVWNQDTVFGLGSVTIEALEHALDSYFLGVFVFTPDDLVSSRGAATTRARDNVVFEAGLFIGRLGRYRSFVVHPKSEIALPSDLLGLSTASYDPTAPTLRAALGPACESIRISSTSAIASARRRGD